VSLLEFLLDAWMLVLIIVVSAVLIGAELWLLTLDGTEPMLVAVLVGMTGTALLTLAHTLWEDWR
jgi:hypothetical protein